MEHLNYQKTIYCLIDTTAQFISFILKQVLNKYNITATNNIISNNIELQLNQKRAEINNLIINYVKEEDCLFIEELEKQNKILFNSNSKNHYQGDNDFKGNTYETLEAQEIEKLLTDATINYELKKPKDLIFSLLRYIEFKNTIDSYIINEIINPSFQDIKTNLKVEIEINKDEMDTFLDQYYRSSDQSYIFNFFKNLISSKEIFKNKKINTIITLTFNEAIYSAINLYIETNLNDYTKKYFKGSNYEKRTKLVQELYCTKEIYYNLNIFASLIINSKSKEEKEILSNIINEILNQKKQDTSFYNKVKTYMSNIASYIYDNKLTIIAGITGVGLLVTCLFLRKKIKENEVLKGAIKICNNTEENDEITINNLHIKNVKLEKENKLLNTQLDNVRTLLDKFIIKINN